MTSSEPPKTTPSTAIVEAIAAEKGIDPIDLECVLADVIDPLALDALFEETADRPTNPSGVVEFPFCGSVVVLRADGSVDVR